MFPRVPHKHTCIWFIVDWNALFFFFMDNTWKIVNVVANNTHVASSR